MLLSVGDGTGPISGQTKHKKKITISIAAGTQIPAKRAHPAAAGGRTSATSGSSPAGRW